ncbi:enkurin [Chironomus tepperi]|uniref:enkurin n=1 Tax=Chironomus tepperi TaxID=113505 RepID=UPI00391EEB13
MSIVRITSHNENIYNIELPDEKKVSAEKAIMYQSKFKKSICEAEKELKSNKFMQHKTFGLPDESSNVTTDKFLKKDDGIIRHYIRPKTSHSKCESRRPPVPKHNELNVTASMMNLTEKNFKVINIKRAKSAMIRNPPGPKCFEQKSPIYIHMPKFGKTPKYLEKRKEEMTEMKEMSLRQKERAEREELMRKIREITQPERKKLLEGLKHNWHKMQEEYQKMPLLIDSVPKMIRKTKLENNLKSLENDICLLNTNSSRIFIVPN